MGDIEKFQQTPFCHTYSIGHIHLFLLLVLSSSTSLRAASRVIEIVTSFFGLPLSVPSWYTGRLWLLRLGYYKLTRTKQKAADWIWIIDHTIQWGSEKCLVILGLRQRDLPVAETILNHEDVEPIAMFPVTSSNGQIVYQQLEQAIEHTGVPKEIISDHGSDLKKGIEIFCNQHPQTCFIYDIKHKVAAVLKRELKDDKDWNEFVKLANETRRKVQQTSLAALAPPNQRTKSRYMNVDKLVKWAMEILCFLDQQQLSANEHFDPQQIEAKLSWLAEFRQPLLEWQEMMQIVELAESFIKFNGIYRDCHIDLMQVEGFVAHTKRTKRLREELLNFIAQQSQLAKPNERLLGSSEVIESVIGKLKNMESDQNKSGFTGLLLSLAAMVSKTTEDVIHKAMESVPTKRVHEWIKENIGKSVQSKRKEVFRSARKAEQKWDEIQWVFE
ncbi:MAG TPA: hypothetical protein VKA34_16655 [Balneolales bacterium]|nr:hypothetical protein [Balneolales bacterium]